MSTWEPDEDPAMHEMAEDTVPSLVGLVRGGTEQENPPSCTHHIVAAWVLSSLARASLRFQVRPHPNGRAFAGGGQRALRGFRLFGARAYRRGRRRL